jgi:heme exporter protein B
MPGFLGLVRRDLQLALHHSGDTALVLAFFVLTVVLFPFGIGPEPDVLARVAPGILWVAALLAALLSLDRMFLPDYEDGSLDLIVLSRLPLELAALAKIVAHWISSGLPLALISPALAVVVDLEPGAMPILVISLLLGTPTLSLIGGVAAALTLGARRQGVLLSLLVLPLYVPPLVFGAGAIEAQETGGDPRADLLLLAALLAAALALAPWAAAAAVRQATE